MMWNRSADSQLLLELDTAIYFQGLSEEAAEEESRLAHALSQCAAEIDIDRIEPFTMAHPAV
jgi:hypothetical protein